MVVGSVTTPLIDLGALKPEPLGDGIPDFHASSGESGEPRVSPSSDSPGVETRPGLLGRRRAASPPKSKTAKQSVPKLPVGARKKIADAYRFIGAFMTPFDEVIAEEIVSQADACAEAVYNLAQENEEVRRVIYGFITTSVWGAVVAAHLPIMLAVTARKASNPKLKMTAMGTYAMMKMSDKNLVPENDA